MDSWCRAGERVPGRYRPRRPSASVLYRCVQEQLEIWLARGRDGHDDEWSVPDYVEREFRRYLECGMLAFRVGGRPRLHCFYVSAAAPLVRSTRCSRVSTRYGCLAAS
jgi:hypothetical protein